MPKVIPDFQQGLICASVANGASVRSVARDFGTARNTVRKLVDCLIAAIAIRDDVPILHLDADFDVLAQHTALRVAFE